MRYYQQTDKFQIFVILFANHSSADVKLSNTQTQLSQSGQFLGRLFGPLLKTGLPLIKNVFKLLDNSVLIPLELTATASAADAEINIKILVSGKRSLDSTTHNTTVIISNNEMKDISKIVKSLEYSGLLLKGVTETVQNEVKELKGGFLTLLLGTLGAILLRRLLIRKGIYRAGKGKEANRASEGIIRAGYGHPLSSTSQNKMDF